MTDEQKTALHEILSENFGTVERRLFSAKPAAVKPATAAPKASSGSGIGSAIAASALGGAASATVNNIITKIESLFKRDLYVDYYLKSFAFTNTDSPLISEERSLTEEQKADLHEILVEHFADAAIERRLFSAKPAAVKPATTAPKASSGSGIGSAIAASALGGAASATVNNIITKIESLFKRDL